MSKFANSSIHVVPLLGVPGVHFLHWILLIKLSMSEWRLLERLLANVLDLKERMPCFNQTSSVFVVARSMVQLIMSVVLPSTPVVRAVALRVSSLCVFVPP